MFTFGSFRLYIVLYAVILSGVFLKTPVVHAIDDPCSANIEGQSKTQLQVALDACNADVEKWTTILNNTKQESASFATDVAYLTAKINAAQASIKARNIAISNLGKDISNKQAKINTLDQRIEEGRATLAVLLRKTSEIDQYSLAEIILSGQNLSDFFVDVDAYSATSRSLEDVFAQLRGVKSETEAEKATLAKQQAAEANAKAEIEAAKKQVEISQAQKKVLLAESQNKEKTYGQVLVERQAKAAQIRAVLFPLRDSVAIPFGVALQYANAAGAKTGVRPALILAIMQQESNLGANVGSCVITNLTTGETKSVNSGKIFSNGIHPTRDLPLLQSILTGLGRDPMTTKVSCPYGGGYGGAMGPTQFIPSTWKIIEGKVASVLNKSLPDPWNPEDAIWAAAFLLAGNGANGGTYTNERTAACKYYSGKNCYASNGKANVGLSYGNQVMAKATTIQTTMIDPLQGL